MLNKGGRTCLNVLKQAVDRHGSKTEVLVKDMHGIGVTNEFNYWPYYYPDCQRYTQRCPYAQLHPLGTSQLTCYLDTWLLSPVVGPHSSSFNNHTTPSVAPSWMTEGR